MPVQFHQRVSFTLSYCPDSNSGYLTFPGIKGNEEKNIAKLLKTAMWASKHLVNSTWFVKKDEKSIIPMGKPTSLPELKG